MRRLSADEFKKAKDAGPVQILDVREPGEYVAGHVAGSILIPLAALEDQTGLLDPEKPLYILCARGVRAAKAAQRLEARGFKDAFVIEGGTEAWAARGYPLEITSRVWALERQVRLTAGSLVLAGLGLGFAVSPWFFALSAFVGAGLVFSGATNICGMAMILARMPWNRDRRPG